MRKIYALLLIFLFSLSFAYAAEKHSMDLINNDVKIVTLAIRDIVIFDFPVREYNKDDIVNDKPVVGYQIIDKEEAVMLREIDFSKNLVGLTVFIEGSEVPQYVNINKDNMLKLDFDRDEVDDVFVVLREVNQYGATLMFQKNLEKGQPNLRFYQRLYANEDNKLNYITYIKRNILYLITIAFMLILLFNSRFVKLKYRIIRRKLRKS
nr:hypothetical protein [Candidatus Woesearchaeota archaeon]